MAVHAFASVVLQKLCELPVDGSFASNKIIGPRLKSLKEFLESRLSLDDENDDQEIKKWTREDLGHLYSIEDLIESFALSFTSQRKKLGCLMNHALFLKKFTALKMLNCKLYSIQTKVGGLTGESPINEETEGPGSSMMRQSYKDLDAHSKLCLIYMTLFPKDLDIPVRRLQRLWMAEGFVEQPQKQEFQEDVALRYFENLVTRELIIVTKPRSDGSPRRCQLQCDLDLRRLLEGQAKEICLFQVLNDRSDAQQHTRRLVEYADGGNSPVKPWQIQKVRSYISFNFQNKDTPAKHVSSLVRKYQLLRVVDLEGVYQPSLPENLGDLFHLRYLGLRWTFLEKLPKSVGELLHLQTLDLKHTRIDKIPASVWKLKTLQHLNLNEVHLDKDTLRHLRHSLPQLLTLWGLSVSHESPIENGLNKLRRLRELGITFRFIKIDQATDQSTQALADWISQLVDLRSLRLRSTDDSGKPWNLSLKPFSSLVKLSHMKLLGRLQQLPPSCDFPPCIKVLTLSLSNLSQDPMPILGTLPDLTVLRLLGQSYSGETMECLRGGFKKLEVLKLWLLENLRQWEVEEGAMLTLKEVNIRKCSKMESFPINLLKQKSFEYLILNNMSPAFKENIDSKYQFKVYTKDYNIETAEDLDPKCRQRV